MSQAEKNNILDQHKSVYDGYVTEYGKDSNTQPLYVQDYANDKQGITVSNKGVVKPYTNMNINEDFDMRDKIADGPMDLENGTVDLDSELMHDEYPSPNEDEFDFISLGLNDDDMEELDIDETSEMEDDINDPYEFDIDEMEDYSTQPMNETDFEDEVDDEILPEFVSKLNESLDMFKRFKNYN
jgi:hypothetical protein